MKAFTWKDAVLDLETNLKNVYIFHNTYTNSSIMIDEAQFNDAFTEEYGFNESDREALLDMEYGECFNFSEQWKVLYTQIKG